MLIEGSLRPLSGYAWLAALVGEGVVGEAPDPTLQSYQYVAVDARTCERWLDADWGAAWELTCLYCGLDPQPLNGNALCWGRHLDPDGLQWMDNHNYQELWDTQCQAQLELGERLRVVNDAIRTKQLPVLSSHVEERRRHRDTPLLRRVSIDAFCKWAKLVSLPRMPPWPARQGDSSPARAGGVEEMLMIPLRNPLLRTVKSVEAYFAARLRAGRLETPTEEDIERYLVDVLHEPANRKRAALIAQLVRPVNTPHGPRKRKHGVGTHP